MNNINDNQKEPEIKSVKTISNTSAGKRLSKITNEDSAEKQKKMSKALNRFRKKMSKETSESGMKNSETDRSNSHIKKSERISGIAKLLEKKMVFGKTEENSISNNNRPVTDDECNKNENILDIIEKMPTPNGRKRKPSQKKRFGNFDED